MKSKNGGPRFQVSVGDLDPVENALCYKTGGYSGIGESWQWFFEMNPKTN
jgi:hypothetical protein